MNFFYTQICALLVGIQFFLLNVTIPTIDDFNTIGQLGPSALMAIIIYFLWRREKENLKKVDALHKAIIEEKDKRISEKDKDINRLEELLNKQIER